MERGERVGGGLSSALAVLLGKAGQQLAKKLADIYREALNREPEDSGLDEEFGSDAKNKLDNLFD